MKPHSTVDDYIATFPNDVQEKLEAVRQTIKIAAPSASEKISYGIPTFYLNGNLIHFGGYRTHIGLYPGSAPIKDFAKELLGYETSKGTVKFPLDKSLPLDLIQKITLHCVEKTKSIK